jgi:hypothetical protein
LQQNFVLDESSGAEMSSIKMEVETEQTHRSPNPTENQFETDISIENQFETDTSIEKRSPNRTPTNLSPILTPHVGSPNELNSIFLTSILDTKEESQLLEDLFIAMANAQQPVRTSNIEVPTSNGSYSYPNGSPSHSKGSSCYSNDYGSLRSNPESFEETIKHSNNFFAPFAAHQSDQGSRGCCFV